MKASKWLVGIPTLVCAMLFLSSAFADVVPVANPSFETLPLGGLPHGCGPGCHYSIYSDNPSLYGIPGWTTSGTSGEFQPGSAGFFNSLPSPTIAYSDTPGTGIISQQIVGQMVQLGVTYTLQVDIGRRTDFPTNDFAGSADLMLGSTMCVATGSEPALGYWSTYTAVCSTNNAGDAGGAITIQLNSSGAIDGGFQGDFDNVQLTDNLNATPEPASVFLMGSGLLAMGGILRRRIFRR